MSTERAAPRWWQTLAAKASVVDPRAERELGEELPVGPTAAAPDSRPSHTDLLETTEKPARRDFFKMMGLSAAAALAACKRAPVQKAIPFVDAPEEVTPGLSAYYASTCGGCAAGCGVLVKVRDGRPIKIEGNDAHPLSFGGVCAVGQAHVLALYDATRARGPMQGGAPTSWSTLDAKVRNDLQSIAARGKAVRVVVPARLGPTAESVLKEVIGAVANGKIVRFESIPELSPIAEAHALTHGARVVPVHRFDLAELVVSVGADFLGTWVQPVAYTAQWSRARVVSDRKRKITRLVALEPHLTLTGSNADQRVPIAPSDELPVIAALARRVLHALGRSQDAPVFEGISRVREPEVDGAVLDGIADALVAAKGKALVVCGAPDVGAQALVNALNDALGAYGGAIDFTAGVELGEGDTFDSFLSELRAGAIGAAFFLGANPVYAHPDGDELARLVAALPLSVSLGDRLDETARVTQLLAPDHHPLESWDDACAQRSVVSLRQPTLTPLFDTRDALESLLAWVGAPRAKYDLLRARWEREVRPLADDPGVGFDAFWDRSVRDGLAILAPPPRTTTFDASKVSEAVAKSPVNHGDFELVLHPSVAMRDGALANNAWLQELPDPLSKVAWTNHASIAPQTAKRLGVDDGDVVTIATDAGSIEVPVVVQPGTHPRAVAVALGYGRTAVGPVGDGVGARVVQLAPRPAGTVVLRGVAARVARTGRRHELARTQTESSLQGRDHVRELSVAETLAGGLEPAEPTKSIWQLQQYANHRWAMFVDLNACTGCSACIVACQSENNIPSVGEDEVRRGREMSWMRIDRYYAGNLDNPRTMHQPMMCQHCENAPCETVCPVLATVHSSEGLNQQVYNRCVGTRYCANNCPTKVRRFNWFDYPHDDPLARMVLNPDVVVRGRGVMEKCSMCVQRIQEGKAKAKLEGRPLRDGDIRTACQQTCPAGAIVFGDSNDADSEVAKRTKDGRTYRILDELNIGPSVRYMAKIRDGGEHG